MQFLSRFLKVMHSIFAKLCVKSILYIVYGVLLGIYLTYIKRYFFKALVLLQKCFCSTDYFLLFKRVDSIGARAEFGVFSGLYLYKRNVRASFCNDVNFSARGTKICTKYAVSLLFQILAGGLLTFSAYMHSVHLTCSFTPLNVRRCIGDGPYFAMASRCSFVP